MPINDTDKGWVKNAIAEALKDRRSGWKESVRLWSLPSVAATLLVFAAYQWTNYVEFRTDTKNEFKKIDGQFLSLRALISAIQPLRRESQQAATLGLEEARKHSVQISKDAVQQAGASFIEAARDEQRAWPIALEFVAYRSLLNLGERIPPTQTTPPAGSSWTYSLRGTSDNKKSDISLSLNTIVPSDKAAQFDLIGIDQNQGKPGPAYLVVKGGAITLDGCQLRNIIFEDVEIHYSGASVILENVMFVNCRFFFDNGDRGRHFADQILRATRVTWKAGGSPA